MTGSKPPNKMFAGMKFVCIMLLFLAQSSIARPKLWSEKTGTNFHLTNIGDITSKDIMQLADKTTPNPQDMFNPGQIDDPYENNIEAETLEYSKTRPIGDSPDLATPKDQEEKFVDLLKKQYKGTFPEYGKETKSDFSKNQELEDNLNVQPETVYFGHSDKYHGKKDSLDNFPIPDEATSEEDNLNAYDEDADLLNNESLKSSSSTISPHDHSNEMKIDKFEETTSRPSSHNRHHKTQSIEDILREYDGYGDNLADEGEAGIASAEDSDDDGHKSFSGKDDGYMDLAEKPGNKNGPSSDHMINNIDDDHVNNNADDEMGLHMSEHVTDHGTDDMTNGMADQPTDRMTEDNGDDMDDDQMSKEAKKLKEKTEEEALWDTNEKLRQQHARKKKQKTHKKEKEKIKDLSQDILKDFDELKKHNTKASTKANGHKLKTDETNQHNKKESSSNKAGKHIKSHDESQSAGDAILDFLDKLLEKDPKELKHDVLAMTKEMQKEGESSSDEPGKETTMTEAPSSSDSSTMDVTESDSKTMADKPSETKETPSSDKKPDEVDKWITQLENDIETEKEDTGKLKEQKESNEGNKGKNEDYYDEEYDQFHEVPQDIYPDYGSQAEQQKINDEKTKEDKAKEHIKKEEDAFDFEEFKEEALKMHNEYRRRHDAMALTWSDSLAKKAQSTASKLLDATRSSFKRELEKQGENIAILPYSTKNIAKEAVEKWYGEITKFSFTSPNIKPETRDFTQIIWKNTKEVGMGFGHSSDRKKTLVVALYSPVGNDKEKLRDNLNTVHNDPYADI